MPCQSSSLTRASAFSDGLAFFTAVVMCNPLPTCSPTFAPLLGDNPTRAFVWSITSPRVFVGSLLTRALHPPFSYGLGMLRVVAIGVEPKTMKKALSAADFILGSALDEGDKLTVRAAQLSEHFGELKVFLPLRHLSVEGIDAAVGCGVPWRLSTLENNR